MLQNHLEWLEFAFERFEFRSKGSNLHSNASNPFEWFKFAFKCCESLSKGLKLRSNASNPVQVVRICIRMARMPFKWF